MTITDDEREPNINDIPRPGQSIEAKPGPLGSDFEKVIERLDRDDQPRAEWRKQPAWEKPVRWSQATTLVPDHPAALESKAARDARLAVDKQLEICRKAYDAVQAVGLDEKQERARFEKAVRECVARNETVAFGPKDWTTERIIRRAVWEREKKILAPLGVAYDKAYAAGLEGQRALLVSKVPDARTKALKALDVAHKAVSEWLAVLVTASQATAATHEGSNPWASLAIATTGRASAIDAHLAAAVDAAHESSELVEGTWLREASPLEPPLHVRETLMRRRETARRLAVIEFCEGYVHTRHTKDRGFIFTDAEIAAERAAQHEASQ
jgi:hypothetical protein